MDFKKTGQFIQTRRKEKELTQKQLADILGISDKTISKWETGKSFPDFTLVTQLCQILEINVNELLSGEALSSKEYPEKAEVNMISLMEKLKRGKIKNILFVSISVVLMVLSMYSLMWVEFAPDEWYLLDWFYEPYTLFAEGLFLGDFFLISSGMDAKARFRLAEKFILCVGVVISLFSLEMALLRTDEISNLNVLSVGTCLISTFYAFCFCIVLILLEMIREKVNVKVNVKVKTGP